MDPELYYGLVRYLGNGKMPTSLSEEKQLVVRRVSKSFETNGTKLYHIGKKGKRTVATQQEKPRLLKEIHDGPLGGHQGQNNTFERISRAYYWPGMKDDIREYVRTCDLCQKRAKKRETAPLGVISRTPAPFHHVGIDVIGPLPRALTGKRYVVVAVDLFTKWVEARALTDADAQSIASFVHEEIICRHGIPRMLTSDQGTEFINELVSLLTRRFGIKHIRTTPYHPQANGQTERTNQTLKNLLAKLSADEIGRWDHYLPNALFVTRTTLQASVKSTPAELLYGRQLRDNLPSLDGEPYDIEPEDHLMITTQRLQRIRKDAHGFILRAQARQKEAFDRAHGATEDLTIGDRVLLFRDIVEASWSAKLEPKWEGPYYIQSIKGTTYFLRSTDGEILRSGVHRNRLKKYQERRS